MIEFYHLNPTLMMRYQPFMNEVVKNKAETASMEGWMAGIYVRDAIGSNFSKSHRYPEAPISFYAEPEVEEEAPQFTDADRFQAWAMVFNKQFGERKGVIVDADGAEVTDSNAENTGGDANTGSDASTKEETPEA